MALPAGRRKAANVTLLTSLVEGKMIIACQLLTVFQSAVLEMSIVPQKRKEMKFIFNFTTIFNCFKIVGLYLETR